LRLADPELVAGLPVRTDAVPDARVALRLLRGAELAGDGRDARVDLVRVGQLVRFVDLRLRERRRRLAAACRCGADAAASGRRAVSTLVAPDETYEEPEADDEDRSHV